MTVQSLTTTTLDCSIESLGGEGLNVDFDCTYFDGDWICGPVSESCWLAVSRLMGGGISCRIQPVGKAQACQKQDSPNFDGKRIASNFGRLSTD